MANLASIAGAVGQLKAQAELRQQIDYESRMLEKQKQQADYTEKLQIEGEKRAQAWELQKMELASQHDFMINAKQYEIKKMREFTEREEKIARAKVELEEFDRTFGQVSPDHPLFPQVTKYRQDRMAEAQGWKTEFPFARPAAVPTTAQTFKTLDNMTAFLASFQEKGVRDVQWPWPNITYDLAVLDKTGKPYREATPEEKALYNSTKEQVKQLTQQYTPSQIIPAAPNIPPATPTAMPGAPSATTTQQGIVPKPIEFPDAVWSVKYNKWTIIRGGKLIGID